MVIMEVDVFLLLSLQVSGPVPVVVHVVTQATCNYHKKKQGAETTEQRIELAFPLICQLDRDGEKVRTSNAA